MIVWFKSAITGWTFALQSRKFHEFVPGTPYPAFGAAILFNRRARQLQLSVWNRKRSMSVPLSFARATR